MDKRITTRIADELFEKGLLADNRLIDFINTLDKFRFKSGVTNEVTNSLTALLLKLTLANYYDKGAHKHLDEIRERIRRRRNRPRSAQTSPTTVPDTPIETQIQFTPSAMYMNWEVETHFHIENAEFVQLGGLMRVAKVAQRINFSAEVRREKTRQMLNDIVRFEITKRNRAPSEQ